MIAINLVFEDQLSEVVLRVILKQSRKNFEVLHCFPDLTRHHSSSGFGYIKSKIKDFNQAAKGMPFLVLTDLDKDECPPKLIREWLPVKPHPNLIFRVAKREVESWVMADRRRLIIYENTIDGGNALKKELAKRLKKIKEKIK